MPLRITVMCRTRLGLGRAAMRVCAAAMAALAQRMRFATLASKAASSGGSFLAALRLPKGAPTFAKAAVGKPVLPGRAVQRAR
jgi:hypothetical protein